MKPIYVNGVKRTQRACSNEANCIELTNLGLAVVLSDSKPGGLMFLLTPGEAGDLIGTLKATPFSRLRPQKDQPLKAENAVLIAA